MEVWVPTGRGSTAHGGPHGNVREQKGGYTNVYPAGKSR
ncbi:polymorphic toxin type 37 domain-containing protein [Nocardia beijingensis]|uniref:Polymorphic toxin type 37 domain-containing protein n=1 Tax=Nocardia beijingensis TaxID=95162 RepID=A0ABW7WGY1_9NOCA